jgi:hypothetical protein
MVLNRLPPVAHGFDRLNLLNARLGPTAGSDANLLAVAPEHFPKALLESNRLIGQEVSVLFLGGGFHTRRFITQVGLESKATIGLRPEEAGHPFSGRLVRISEVAGLAAGAEMGGGHRPASPPRMARIYSSHAASRRPTFLVHEQALLDERNMGLGTGSGAIAATCGLPLCAGTPVRLNAGRDLTAPITAAEVAI